MAWTNTAKAIFLMGCVATSIPAAAQNVSEAPSVIGQGDKTSQQDAIYLWGKVTHGMTKAEAKALHPVKDIEISENCFAKLDFKVKNSKIYAVSLSSSSKNKERFKCNDVAYSLLKEKYGEPESEKLVEDNSFGASLASSLNQMTNINKGTSGTNVIMKKVSLWTHGNLSINFDRDPDLEWSWEITYRKKEVSSGAL